MHDALSTPASLTAPGASTAGEVLVLLAHPDLAHSVVNQALLQAAARSGPRVAVRDLYALYPDYLIDTATEQACLARARLVVWQHPIHWYHMPALMKLWVDEVLTYGWAYGPEGTRLHGKDLWLVASTGGPVESYHPASYNRHPFSSFLPPYEQTAALCGMRFLPPLLLHGAHRVAPDALAAHAKHYAERLRRYPAWPERDPTQGCPNCEVPASARPSPAHSTP